MPIGNSCPENALHVMTFDGPDTASTAVTVKFTVAPALLAELTLIVPGSVRTGGVASGRTVTARLDDALPPRADTVIPTSVVTWLSTSLNWHVMEPLVLEIAFA